MQSMASRVLLPPPWGMSHSFVFAFFVTLPVLIPDLVFALGGVG